MLKKSILLGLVILVLTFAGAVFANEQADSPDKHDKEETVQTSPEKHVPDDADDDEKDCCKKEHNKEK